MCPIFSYVALYSKQKLDAEVRLSCTNFVLNRSDVSVLPLHTHTHTPTHTHTHTHTHMHTHTHTHTHTTEIRLENMN